MPLRIGTPELIILLIIILLLFGVGRISRVASELGRGIREFRRGFSESEEEDAGSERKEKSEGESKAS
jgi:sec-independent protein translocase protein TatA